MSRPLNLKDLCAIYDLQTQGLDLDLERARLWPHSALTAALTLRLPFSEIGASTIVLYRNGDRSEALGLIQTRVRHNRLEADVTFIAPDIETDHDAVTIWYRLLAEAANRLGEEGVQRLFAQLVEGNGKEEVFRQAGFTLYAHEDIYLLPATELGARPEAGAPRRLRRQRKRDAWYLLRLYADTTPRHVQQAEGMITSEGHVGKLGDWWDQSLGTGYVLEEAGELCGATRIIRGRAANWLRLYVHPQARSCADDVLADALGLLRTARPRPVYSSVRDYEGGVRGALEAAGFEHQARRCLMVKHMTVRVKEAVPWLAPAREPAGPVVRVSTHSFEGELEPEPQSA